MALQRQSKIQDKHFLKIIMYNQIQLLNLVMDLEFQVYKVIQFLMITGRMSIMDNLLISSSIIMVIYSLIINQYKYLVRLMYHINPYFIVLEKRILDFRKNLLDKLLQLKNQKLQVLKYNFLLFNNNLHFNPKFLILFVIEEGFFHFKINIFLMDMEIIMFQFTRNSHHKKFQFIMLIVMMFRQFKIFLAVNQQEYQYDQDKLYLNLNNKILGKYMQNR